MLKIDCLLLNTDYVEGVKKYMHYVGASMRAEGGFAGFEEVYHQMRKEGIEVDIETAGFLYLDALAGKEGYSTAEDVHHASTREFEETGRNLLFNDKEVDSAGKEKEIGNLSPSKDIVRRLINTFKSKDIVDTGTKTILRQLQDWYVGTMSRMEGKDGGRPAGKDTRSWEQVLEDGIEKMNLGERDVNGKMHNLETLHKGINEEVAKLAADLRAEGKEVEAAQWEQNVKSFQETVYSVALNHPEAKKVVDGALIEEGFAKKNKAGEIETDWEKLSGESHSAAQVRDHVVSAMKKHGMDEFTANRVADNMQREFVDALSTMLKIQDAKQEKAKQTWDKQSVKKDMPVIDDVVAESVKTWDNYRKYAGREGEELILSKKTAGDVLKNALMKLGMIYKNAKGESRLSIDAVSNSIDKLEDFKNIVRADFIKQGYDAGKADRLTEAVGNMYEDMFDRVKEHVIGKQDAIEQTWYPKTSGKSLPDLHAVIMDRLQEFKQYQKITGNKFKELIFKNRDAKRILAESIKNSIWGKENSTGEKTANWKQLGIDRPTEAQLKDTVKEYLKSEGFIDATADRIADSITPTYGEFVSDIDAHAKSILEVREKAMERESPERQTALNTLAELSSLGIFDAAHKKLLESVVGVDNMTSADLQSIKNIADAFKTAKEEAGTMHGEYLEATMSREINNIVSRNRASKTTTLKIAKALHTWFSVGNFTLISGPFNMIQNLTSGRESVAAANIEVKKQTGMSFSDRKLWWDTVKDVAMGGVSGEASMKFGNTSALDKFNTPLRDIGKKPGNAIATNAIYLFRAALSGLDAANKAVIRNKDFIRNTHESLIRNGWGKSEATDFIYEMLYGQNRTDTKYEASKIVDKYADKMGIGSSAYSRERAIERLTDDMVKANIAMSTELGYNMGTKPPIDASTVEAAFEAARHTSGVALGHEANNAFSRGRQAGRAKAEIRYQDLMKKGKYSEAAYQSMINTVYYDGILRLASGGANWAVLGLEATGGRLPFSIHGLNKANKKIWDPSDPISMEADMRDRATYQKQITRGLFGITKAIAVLGGMAAYGAAVADDDDDGVFAAASKNIQEKNAYSKIFKRTAGPLALIVYLSSIAKGNNEKTAMEGAIEFITETTNSNPAFSAGGKLVKAGQQAHGGHKNKAMGTVGEITGDVLPPFPFYRPYKQLIQLAKEIATGEAPAYNKSDNPQNFTEGILKGGPVQDMLKTIPSEYLESIGFENWGDNENAAPQQSGKYF